MSMMIPKNSLYVDNCTSSLLYVSNGSYMILTPTNITNCSSRSAIALSFNTDLSPWPNVSSASTWRLFSHFIHKHRHFLWQLAMEKAVHTLLLPGILIFAIRVPFPELHGLSSYVANSTTVAKFLEHNFRIILVINALTF